MIVANGKRYRIPKKTKAREGGGPFSSLAALGDLAYMNVANAYRKTQPGLRPLQKGERHLIDANFAGPGTRISDPAVRNYPPSSVVDGFAKQHDLAYEDIFKRITDPKAKRKAIRAADNTLIEQTQQRPRGDKHRAEVLAAMNAKIALEDSMPAVAAATLGELRGGQNRLAKQQMSTADLIDDIMASLEIIRARSQ